MNILKLEEDDKLLTFLNSNEYPVWFYMRFFFYESLVAKLNNEKQVKTVRRFGSKAFIFLFKAWLFNLFHMANIRNKKIMFYSASREALIDGKYFDQYVDDYFAVYKKQSAIIQHPPIDWKWKFPRYNKKLYFIAPFLFFSSLRAKISKKDLDVVRKTFDYIYSKAKKEFDIGFNEDEINYIIYSTKYEMFRTRHIARWMANKCKHSKILIMIGASYSWNCELVKTIKSKGVLVADLQHGCISDVNYVYNYSPMLLKTMSSLNLFPNYYLTYGDWWNTQTNISYDSFVSLGNPFRENRINKLGKKNKNIISIIGCNNKTKDYLQLAIAIKEKCSSFEVVFRPHPTERNETLLLKDIYSSHDISIDYGRDLYDLLSHTFAIISEVSTVLFEAIGIVDHIYVWNTLFSKVWLPTHPFMSFDSIDDFALPKDGSTKGNINEENIWKKDATHNYQEFIKKVVKIEE